MLTDEEFRLFSNLVYEGSGIYLKEARKDFLENRLAKRMAATGIMSPYRYYRFVTEIKRTELLILLDLLTVNETSFFRNRPQMDLLRNVILPDVTGSKESGGRKSLRIWSAGCSTGEEPYTIAMVVNEALRLEAWEVLIFASDLSLKALHTASIGEYAGDKVETAVDDYFVTRYFEKIIPSNSPDNPPSPSFSKGGMGGFAEKGCEGEFEKKEDWYRVKDEIRNMVVFDFHNLKNDNGLRDLDIIFCRNVMIYFDEEEQKRLIEKFRRSLNPGGYLLLGHAESLHGRDTGFRFIHDNKGTAYRKSRGGKNEDTDR